MSGTDYNSGGFNQGDDGAVFGDPGTDPGTISDYDTWDWKQIEAAIKGMSAGVADSGNEDHAQSVASPQSIQDAADAFYEVQLVLAGIAESLANQGKALAGDNGPWKGDAADAFLDMMNTFSKQVAATADVLSGGSTGQHSVPQQLADNAANLTNAQNKIGEIDAWYANQATLMGVTPMSNGLIPISKKPQLVKMMTNDMRAVLKSLASEYQVTIDTVRSPTPITNPLGNGPQDNDPQQQDPADLDDQPDMAGVDPEMPRSLTADPQSTPELPADLASRFPGDLATGDDPGAGLNSAMTPMDLDKALNPDSALSPSAFPGGLGTGDSGGLPLSDKLATDPSAFDDAAPAPFPGSDGVGDGIPDAFPGGLGTGTGTGLDDGIDTPSLKSLSSPGLDDAEPESFPGDLATESGAPEGLDTAGLGGMPGLKSLATDTPGLDGEPEAFPGGDEVGDGVGGAGGMPMSPGMGAGGAGQTGALDPSDASGLLDSDAEPWTGSPDTDADITPGTLPGTPGLDLPTDEEAEAFPGSDEVGNGIGGM
ncbi:hypothetical protein POF50_026580, partial [Streptomyces sp. SL13]|nr:hypothetical protein [Streptantibioticus silvisoli]